MNEERKYICKDEDGYRLYLKKANYTNNGRIYLGLDDVDGGSYCDITINLSDFMIEDDNIVFIDSWVDDDLFEKLEKVGLLTYLDTMQYNYGRYKKCLVNTDVMNEYL